MLLWQKGFEAVRRSHLSWRNILEYWSRDRVGIDQFLPSNCSVQIIFVVVTVIGTIILIAGPISDIDIFHQLFIVQPSAGAVGRPDLERLNGQLQRVARLSDGLHRYVVTGSPQVHIPDCKDSVSSVKDS